MAIVKYPPFPSRALVIAACNMLKAEGHSGFQAMRLEFDLLDTDAGVGPSLSARATSLATYALLNKERRLPGNSVYLQSAIVARAGEIYRSGALNNNIGDKEREAFKRASIEAGTDNDVTESGYQNPETLEVILSRAEGVTPKQKPRKIFIVHGHDELTKVTVARFVEHIGFEAIILHERANQGRTIIEKVEFHGDVGFAIVLLTPDDVGAKLNMELRPRARQNVILELGYFIGRLGRENVCALTSGDLELPSDFSGIVYETLDGGGGWRSALGRELEAVGYEIDWRKVGGGSR